MSDVSIQPPKWGSDEILPLPNRFNTAIRALVRERIEASDVPWSELVFGHELDLFSRADAEAVERAVLDEGYRFEFSATASLESEPHKYKRPEKAAPSDEPEATIAVIDDSGGTLTAPILEGFAGVICLGGTVRSHLGILAREYDVPTLMNCHVANLVDGDVVEIEVTAAPPSADAYETGDTGHARIWKIEGDR
jgi:phosphohistidine swiveling domain-containing protein